MRFSMIFWVLAACDRGDLALPDAGGQMNALSALERDTGQPWRLRYHRDLPTPAFLEGRTAPLAVTPGDAERASRAFLHHYGGLFRIATGDELTIAGADSDELGMTHVRFAQQHGRVPVWGGELRVHFAADGALVRVNGRFIPLRAPSLTPVRSADEARVTAVLDGEALRPELDAAAFTTLAPSLILVPDADGSARLAWHVRVEVEDATRPMQLDTLIAADDGTVLHRSDTLATLEGSGVGVLGEPQLLTVAERREQFWLEDATRGTQKTYSASGRAHLPGSQVHSPDKTRWDESGRGAGAAVDAHAFVAATWDHFARMHGRSGWDGHGHGVRAVVHFGDHFANAFFDGRQLVFGDGDDDLLPLAGALDVVAHEWTHGLTSATAKLALEGESGALNEAISDLFAAFVSGRWQLGATLRRSGPLRDLARPHATGNPETMAEWVDTADDNGGVHVNSTIVSHVGYAMRGALGAERAERIWYRALTRYLTARATFLDAADATLAAAADFGRGEESAVRQAWLAAGVTSE